MVAAATSPDPDRAEPGEQRMILHGVTYKDYVLLGDVLGHRPGLHLTYLRGTLEIMTTSPLHEQLKKLIERLVELHALLRGVRILGFEPILPRSRLRGARRARGHVRPGRRRASVLGSAPQVVRHRAW